MDKDSLGDRMKSNYEKAYDIQLPWRMPVIIRLDGKAFHTFTKNMEKPFDEKFMSVMMGIAFRLFEETHTCVLSYVQSDEISLLLHNYKRLTSEPLHKNKLQKLVSTSAGFASGVGSLLFQEEVAFDARAFVLPENEVANYFIWRQQDAERNSLQMVAQSYYKQRELHGKGSSQLHEMIHAQNDNWNNYETPKKRGTCIYRDADGKPFHDEDIPIFTEDRYFIERHLIQE